MRNSCLELLATNGTVFKHQPNFAFTPSMNPQSLNTSLNLGIKIIGLILFAMFLPSIINEAKWVLAGKAYTCKKHLNQYNTLTSSVKRLNEKTFDTTDGTAINQAFMGALLSAAVQTPNAKLIQATALGCPTDEYAPAEISW